MMKYLFISSFFLTVPALAQVQTGQVNMQQQLNELKARVKALENENNTIIADGRSSDSLVYTSIRNEIFIVFIKSAELQSDYANTCEKIAITGLFTRLMQASNPTSDILGFRFTDVLYSAADKHFMPCIKGEQDRKRFSQVLCKIIENPVVTTLANTNPITSVVAAIINTIAGFTTSKVDLDKEGGRIKDVAVSQEDAIENKNIRAFREELQIYIDFYDALIKTSDEYLQGIKNVNEKYAFLVRSVTDFKRDLYSELDNNENFLAGLTVLLPDPSGKNLNYKQLLSNPKIQKCHTIAEKYPALELEVKKLVIEYNRLLFKFLSDFISILESTRDFPATDIDKSKTEKLVNEIKSFLQGMENSPVDLMDVH